MYSFVQECLQTTLFITLHSYSLFLSSSKCLTKKKAVSIPLSYRWRNWGKGKGIAQDQLEVEPRSQISGQHPPLSYMVKIIVYPFFFSPSYPYSLWAILLSLLCWCYCLHPQSGGIPILSMKIAIGMSKSCCWAAIYSSCTVGVCLLIAIVHTILQTNWRLAENMALYIFACVLFELQESKLPGDLLQTLLNKNELITIMKAWTGDVWNMICSIIVVEIQLTSFLEYSLTSFLEPLLNWSQRANICLWICHMLLI